MAQLPLHLFIRRLRRLADSSQDGGLSDAQLLERFVARRDEAAFEVIVWRHGGMVLNLCRRLLRREQDVEDAFQATFLALVRKASSIGKREALGSWLYKVAYRVAVAARGTAAARAEREQPYFDLPAPVEESDVAWRDLRPVLDEEINRLPARYRAAFVLCCLEGKTSEEAAELLGCPRGTVLSRLARARERLRLRLTRRGVVLSSAALAAVVAEKGLAGTVTPALVETTVKAALHVAAGAGPAALVSSQAAALTEGVLRAMFFKKLNVALAVMLVIAAAGVGAGIVGKGLLGRAAADEGGEKPQPAAAAPEARAEKPPAGGEQPSAAGEKADEKEDPLKAAARRLRSQTNLKQIGVALHNYHDSMGQLPGPAIYDKNGKALLSWRVALLPFVEQDNLYKQFKLDEPWDSAHNKKLLANLPAGYAPLGGPKTDPGMTYYQVFVGKGATFEPRQQLRFLDISDGTSNTIGVVEAGSPVPWTKPEDLPYVADQALPKLGALFDGDFNALFMDGSVRFLSRKIDEATLRAAITRDGGEPIDVEKLVAPRLGGRGPGEKVTAEQVQRENRRLRDVIEKTRLEVDQTKGDIELLKAQIAAGTAVDEKTAKLLQEHAELQDMLQQTLAQLEELKAERERLKMELEKRLKNKQ